MKLNPSRITWSADVSLENLVAVVRSGVLPRGVCIKLDQVFFLKTFLSKDFVKIKLLYEVIDELHAAGYSLFVDWKATEIPSKVEQIATEFGNFIAEGDMLNCMAGIFSSGVWSDPNPQKVDGLKRFAAACSKVGVRSCAVTVLTSKTNDKNTGAVFREFRRTAPEQVRFYANLLLEAKFTDIVCAAPDAISLLKDPRFRALRFNCPGIRIPGTDLRDQSRVMSPKKALELGLSLVIGSNLTDGKEPDIVERVAKNWQRLVSHVEN
jgi:orotidine-5'-phosphate decarboxylase